MTLQRPVWRRFAPRFAERAAEHVRAGGLAAVEHEDRLEVLLGLDARGKLVELAEWALLSIDHREWERAGDGLARAAIREEFRDSVLDWCDRDAAHPGPTRAIALDCRACGACCRAAVVVLYQEDFDRWRAAGREDLCAERYLRRDPDGTVHLRFAEDACRHLGAERNTCAIYELRPENCRDFVIGSEACLSAREYTLGIRDDHG